jgi:hypothetical protein
MAQASVRIIGMLRPENGKSRQDGAGGRSCAITALAECSIS